MLNRSLSICFSLFVALPLSFGLVAFPAKAQPALEELRTYCKADIERLCPGVEPGGGRIIKCLKANKMEMSVGCAMGLKKLKSKM